MPKYFSRVDFETMKVLRKRGSSLKDIAKAVGRSPAAVRRNIKFNSYEEYIASMMKRRDKYQREIEAKSGPVRIVTPASKTCSCCGKVKPITAFNADKNLKDGHKGQCRECINAKVRARRARSRAALKLISEGTKCCYRCHEKKPLSEFYKSRSRKDGHRPYCKTCTAEAQRRSYNKRQGNKVDKDGYCIKNEKPIRIIQTDNTMTEQAMTRIIKETPTPVLDAASQKTTDLRIGEMVHIIINDKIKQGEIVGKREWEFFGNIEVRYLVKIKKLFGYRYADVNEKAIYQDK